MKEGREKDETAEVSMASEYLGGQREGGREGGGH
jgi:hypothetical protein